MDSRVNPGNQRAYMEWSSGPPPPPKPPMPPMGGTSPELPPPIPPIPPPEVPEERFGADLRALDFLRAALFFALLFFFAVLFFAPPRFFLRAGAAFFFDFFAFFAMIASRSLPAKPRNNRHSCVTQPRLFRAPRRQPLSRTAPSALALHSPSRPTR